MHCVIMPQNPLKFPNAAKPQHDNHGYYLFVRDIHASRADVSNKEARTRLC